MNVQDILNEAASSPKKSKSKKSIPTLVLDVKKDKEHINTIEKMSANKANIDTLTAANKMMSEVIIGIAQTFHKEHVSKDELPTTVAIVAGKNEIQVDVAKNQYSAVDIDQEDVIKEVVGKDFDDLFESVTTVSLSKAALEDKTILAKLIKVVGAERFKEFFEVKRVYKPKVEFHKRRFTGDKKVNKLINEGVITPYKPAMRI